MEKPRLGDTINFCFVLAFVCLFFEEAKRKKIREINLLRRHKQLLHEMSFDRSTNLIRFGPVMEVSRPGLFLRPVLSRAWKSFPLLKFIYLLL